MDLKLDNELEFDLRDIFETIWAGKYIIILSGLVSVFFSIYYISVAEEKYKASTTLEIKVEGTRNASSPQIGSLLGLTSGGSSLDNPMIARITGNEFLGHFLRNGFENTLAELGLCGYSQPRRLSFSGMLDFLGARPLPKPSKQQIFFEKIDCLKSMIKIQQFSIYDLTSPAFKLEVTSTKATATALIANELVDKYFEWERSRMRGDYKRTLNYLSKEIASAQIQMGDAKNALQGFMLENATYFSGDEEINAGVDVADVDISFITNLKVMDLGRLEKDKEKVTKVISLLKAAVDIKNIDDALFNSLVDYKEEYSFEFARILSPGVSLENLNKIEFLDLLKEEIDSQENFLRNINISNNERAKMVANYLKVSDEFERLKLDFVTKSAFFEEMKRSLKSKSMEIGINSLNSNELHSIATEPFTPFSPKPKVVILVTGFLFGFVAVLYVLTVQYFRKTILSSYQVNRLFNKEISYELFLKHDLELEKFKSSKIKNYKGLNLSFFENLSSTGKVGCVVEVGNLKEGSKVGKRLALLLSMILAEKNSNVLCVSERKDELEGIKAFGNQENFSGEGQDTMEKGMVKVLNDKVSFLKDNKLFPLSKEHEQFDRVVIDLDQSLGDVTKFDYLQKSDFFVLVAKKKRITIKEVTRYLDFFKENNNKFLGLVLIK